jgi:sec-independent protein translocase protein TatC
MARRKTRHVEKEMPFLEHLEELRWRLIRSIGALGVGMIICFVLAKFILNILTYPATRLDPPLIFQFLKVQGMLIVYIEIGFFGGLMLALPYILNQMWGFVAPGLKDGEQKYFFPLIFSATFLFVMGVLFAYYVILPFALNFFIGLAPSNINANIAIDFYIGFAIRLMFLFGVVFELPVVSYFLAKIGLITPEFMRKYRRHSIIFIFLVAALLTPPDPITQTILGIPLIFLYEFSIFIVRQVEKATLKREKKAEEEYHEYLAEEAEKEASKDKDSE